MKTISLCTLWILLVTCGFLLFYGCRKETSSTSGLSPQQETHAALFSTQAEIETQLAFNDVFDNVIGANNQVGIAGTGVFGSLSLGNNTGNPSYRVDTTHCFSVAVNGLVTSSAFPLRLVIDFGNGCMGNDGHMRYGRIITEYTDRIIVPGSSATTSFDGYRIDSFTISGTQVITNTSGGTGRQFTIDITDARITKPSGNYEEWNSHRQIDQVAGLSTPDIPTDDVFYITGSGYGKVQNGNELIAWQSNISTPLKKEFICSWVMQGVLKVWRETVASNSPWVATLDYGSGNCDNKATLTINGVQTQITLY